MYTPRDRWEAEKGVAEGAPASVPILVLGLGNPILGDDGVGWAVAARVQHAVLDEGLNVEVDYLSVGGLSLMERMIGYRNVILIDSMTTGTTTDGATRVLQLEQIPDSTAGHTASAHDTSLLTALRAGHAMGVQVPEVVVIVAIETQPSYEFAEALSPKVEASVPIATRKVLDLIATAEASRVLALS